MSRETALERELEHLTDLNSTVDLLLATFDKLQADVSTAKSATDSTSALMEDWIKILNQTRFASAVLQDPSWDGSQENDNDETVESLSKQEAQLQTELRKLERENEVLVENLRAGPSPDRAYKRTRR